MSILKCLPQSPGYWAECLSDNGAIVVKYNTIIKDISGVNAATIRLCRPICYGHETWNMSNVFFMRDIVFCCQLVIE